MPGNLPERHNPHHSTHHRQCNCFLTPAALFRTGSKIVGLMTHPKNPGKTVSCDGVTRHPIEDGFWRHLRQDLPPKGMSRAGWFLRTAVSHGSFHRLRHHSRPISPQQPKGMDWARGKLENFPPPAGPHDLANRCVVARTDPHWGRRIPGHVEMAR